ncbi:MAG: branched-chain amino acid transaminase [Parvularculaceae bacterium]
MPIKEAKFIWSNGELVPWADAKVHVMSHALHYATAVFEGMRAYETRHRGTVIFRNYDHIKRLFYSARVYRLPIAHSIEEIMGACRDVVRENGLKSCYIRPLVFLGYGEMGISAPHDKTEAIIAAFPWGAYLGEEGLKNGVDACISSWRRLAPDTMPAGVKASGNYLSSRLIALEARENGFAEGIGLAADGSVSEGAGQNLFIVMNGKLMTPPGTSSILMGITRDTVMTLAKSRGIEVVEQAIAREALYAADEMFFVGTAAEVTPVKSVDRLPVGSSNRPVTTEIQNAFFGLFTGETRDEWGWLDPVA